MADKDKETFGKRFLSIAVTLGMAPINAYVSSWSMSKIWEWFIQAQYGMGPSLGAWFGINILFYSLSARGLIMVKKDDNWNSSHMRIIVALVWSIGSLSMLLSSYLIGSIMGWIS